ncbi:hypothetical protein D4R51_03990 [bacterium]|nr:MAG: hypothetical protein D4R51_03990 [bacterium]
MSKILTGRVSMNFSGRTFPVIPAASISRNGCGYHPKTFKGRGSTVKRSMGFSPVVSKIKENNQRE